MCYLSKKCEAVLHERFVVFFIASGKVVPQGFLWYKQHYFCLERWESMGVWLHSFGFVTFLHFLSTVFYLLVTFLFRKCREVGNPLVSLLLANSLSHSDNVLYTMCPLLFILCTGMWQGVCMDLNKTAIRIYCHSEVKCSSESKIYCRWFCKGTYWTHSIIFVFVICFRC